MRYYIRAHGRLSSITISDTLSQYLVLARGGESDRYGDGKKRAQKWISELAERETVPDKNVSQWVQNHIVTYIVDNTLHDKYLAILPKIVEKTKKAADRRAAIFGLR